MAKEYIVKDNTSCVLVVRDGENWRAFRPGDVNPRVAEVAGGNYDLVEIKDDDTVIIEGYNFAQPTKIPPERTGILVDAYWEALKGKVKIVFKECNLKNADVSGYSVDGGLVNRYRKYNAEEAEVILDATTTLTYAQTEESPDEFPVWNTTPDEFGNRLNRLNSDTSQIPVTKTTNLDRRTLSLDTKEAIETDCADVMEVYWKFDEEKRAEWKAKDANLAHYLTIAETVGSAND